MVGSKLVRNFKHAADSKLVAWRKTLIDLPRWPKRAVLMLNDFFLMSFALWLAMSLRLNTFYIPEKPVLMVQLLGGPVLGLLTFHYFGLYRLITRYIGQQGVLRIYGAVSLAVLCWAMLIVMIQAPDVVPRSVMVMFWLFTIFFVWLSRQTAGWILRADPTVMPARFDNKKNVAIYGAGVTGVQLLEGLRAGSDYYPVGFIDEDSSLWGQNINGVKVFKPHKIAALVRRGGVRDVFIALPDITRRERRDIIRRLEPFPVRVKTLPAMNDIASGKVEVADLRPIDVEDLLGRDAVPPNKTLLARNISGKSVMITGAGGSIGSEISLQVLRQGPKRLVLFESSEEALYHIDHKIRALNSCIVDEAKVRGEPYPDIEIASVLGSVLNPTRVIEALKTHAVETIYHAAAYKHVPIVERNMVAGLNNNTFGTKVLAEAARDIGVQHFVLISTDKAVRPTNVMGASKRLAELVLQGLAHVPGTERKNGNSGTIFTMVRFGNVLDSSGSVVQRFRTQIQDGGPVTVTHRDIIRYFMSIPEAAQLVIQAGAMAQGGEVFVLDMGQPVKIDDLARSMIRLMGLEVRDEKFPNGDIEISYVGLREGEKLFEELLIGDNVSNTEHPRILRNEEEFLDMPQLNIELEKLTSAMNDNDCPRILDVLTNTVEGYKPDEALRGDLEIQAKCPADCAPEHAAESDAKPSADPESVDTWRQSQGVTQ